MYVVKELEAWAGRDFRQRGHHVHSFIPLTFTKHLCAQHCGHHDEQDTCDPTKREAEWGRQIMAGQGGQLKLKTSSSETGVPCCPG